MGSEGRQCLVSGCIFLILVICILPFMRLNLVAVGGSQVKTSIGALFVPSISSNPAAYTFSNRTTIFFVLLLHNDAYEMGVYYDNITLRFFYVESNTSVIPIATHTIPGIYQEGGDDISTIDHSDHVETGVSWGKNPNNTFEVILRVKLDTSVRFDSGLWKSKRHLLVVQGDVKVNTTTGKIVDQKGVRLKSCTQHESGVHYKDFITFIFCFYIFGFLVLFFSIFLVKKSESVYDYEYEYESDFDW